MNGGSVQKPAWAHSRHSAGFESTHVGSGFAVAPPAAPAVAPPAAPAVAPVAAPPVAPVVAPAVAPVAAPPAAG